MVVLIHNRSRLLYLLPEPFRGHVEFGQFCLVVPTDLAPEFADDARVLNSISGHADSATRERICQEKENEQVRAKAAMARRSMRAFLAEVDRHQKKAA